MTTSTEIESLDHFQIRDQVVEQMLRGNNPRKIAKDLNMKLKDVEFYIGDWQKFARENKYIQDRAKDALINTDKHYDMLVQQLWSVVEAADATDDYKLKASTIKMLADVERQRIEMLQKSGLLENQQLAEQVLETERKQEILVGILRVLMNNHPEIAGWLRKEIARVSGTAESTVISVGSN